MAKVLLRLSSTALAAAFVLALLAASSAVRHVGAGRPAPTDNDLHAFTRAATSTPAAATKQQQADHQPAATTDGAGASGCSNNPNNSGGRCPHRQISSRNASQTTD